MGTPQPIEAPFKDKTVRAGMVVASRLPKADNTSMAVGHGLLQPTSPDFIDNIYPNSLDTFHASSSCSPPSHSPKCCDTLLIDPYVILEGNEADCCKSLGTFRGYDPSLDPYHLYLEDIPRKIVLIIAFDYSADFSKVFDEFKRALTLFAPSLPVFSYSHLSEMHAAMHDKLLRALTASELTPQVMSDDEEWLMLLRPPQHHPRKA